MSGLRGPSGHRIGEWHQRAKHSDEKVRAILADYERGVPGKGYASVGKKHGVPWPTVRDYVQGSIRGIL